MKTKSLDFYYRSISLSLSRIYAPLAAEYGLTVTSVLVLLNINKKKGTPATQIAPEIGMEPNSITRVLKFLEEQKFIIKEKNFTDKRQAIIKLTNKGIEIRSIANKYIKHFQNTIVNTLPSEEIKSFLKVSETINKLINNNKIINKDLKNQINYESSY